MKVVMLVPMFAAVTNEREYDVLIEDLDALRRVRELESLLRDIAEEYPGSTVSLPCDLVVVEASDPSIDGPELVSDRELQATNALRVLELDSNGVLSGIDKHTGSLHMAMTPKTV